MTKEQRSVRFRPAAMRVATVPGRPEQRRLRCALAMTGLVAVLAAPAHSQFDPDAPEPIAPLRGHLVLCGSGEVPAPAVLAFTQLLGSNRRVVSLGANAKLRGQLEEAVGELAATDDTAASIAAALAKCNGAWIASADARACLDKWRGTAVQKALSELIGRGGAIGCSGAAAATLGPQAIVGGERHAELVVGLGLLPGAIIETDFAAAGRRSRLLSAIGSHRTLVGLGIEHGAALVLQRRWLSAVGVGSGHAFVAGSADRPLRIDAIPARTSQSGRGSRGQRGGSRSRGPRFPRTADLIILSRAAVARTLPRFPSRPAPTPHVATGTLIIIGGGGSPPGLNEKFLELAGGPDAPIVYVPCSEAEKIDREPGFCARLRRIGAKDVTWVHTKDRNAADTDEKILGPLRRARGIYFGGGRQWNLVDSYQHTTAHKLMHDVLARGGVIAGSSAGASIQGDYMARGHSLGNTDIMAEGYDTGLGFLTGVAIDQHFTQRGRLPNMTSLVNTYPELLGIGLDEASAILVQGSIATVAARDGRRAHFYDRGVPVFPDRPDYFRLDSGSKFDLAARRPLDGEGRPIPALVDLVGSWSLTEPGADDTARTLRVRLDRTGQLEGESKAAIQGVRLDGVSVHIEFADGPVATFAGTLVAGKLEGKLASREGDGATSVVGERTSKNPEPPRRSRRRRR